MAVDGLRLLTTHGALVRLHLYPGVMRVTSLGGSQIIISEPSQPNSGNLKIGRNGQRADWNGGRGPWARFEVLAASGRDGAVQLRSVGHFEAGRTIFLGVDSCGSLTGQAEPAAFTVTSASDALGGAPDPRGPPAPPVIELSEEMKAAFARDGYLHVPGAVPPAPCLGF